MTAVATREALEGFIDTGVRVLAERGVDARRSDVGRVLDVLFASGAVIDAATLADDEALAEVMARDAFNRSYSSATWDTASGDSQARWLTEYRHALRALAAALTERGETHG